MSTDWFNVPIEVTFNGFDFLDVPGGYSYLPSRRTTTTTTATDNDTDTTGLNSHLVHPNGWRDLIAPTAGPASGGTVVLVQGVGRWATELGLGLGLGLGDGGVATDQRAQIPLSCLFGVVVVPATPLLDGSDSVSCVAPQMISPSLSAHVSSINYVLSTM